MQRGELSYAKVRALTRVACAKTENTLLQHALHGHGRACQGSCATSVPTREAEELSREAQQQENRQLNWYYDADGMLVIKAQLPAEAGQMFIKAIQAESEEVYAPEISAETPNVNSALIRRPARPMR